MAEPGSRFPKVLPIKSPEKPKDIYRSGFSFKTERDQILGNQIERVEFEAHNCGTISCIQKLEFVPELVK